MICSRIASEATLMMISKIISRLPPRYADRASSDCVHVLATAQQDGTSSAIAGRSKTTDLDRAQL
jgi:hypothetical protein